MSTSSNRILSPGGSNASRLPERYDLVPCVFIGERAAEVIKKVHGV